MAQSPEIFNQLLYQQHPRWWRVRPEHRLARHSGRGRVRRALRWRGAVLGAHRSRRPAVRVDWPPIRKRDTTATTARECRSSWAWRKPHHAPLAHREGRGTRQDASGLPCSSNSIPSSAATSAATTRPSGPLPAMDAARRVPRSRKAPSRARTSVASY